MHCDYHGWDKEDEDDEQRWKFATVHGERKGDDAFVIVDFGGSSNAREAVSAMIAAMKQFKCKLHIRRNEETASLLTKLTEASMLKVAPLRGGEHEDFGVLRLNALPSKASKKPWWKFW